MENDIAVRLFKPDEWALYKQIRLKALQSDPAVFASSYEREAKHPDARWQEGVASQDIGIFGVFCANHLIGMTGVAVRKDDPSHASAVLWGSWLEKEYRGKGISRKMYEARLVWVRARSDIKRIVVSHRESNAASKGANQKQGFLFTHSEEHIWQDGTSEPEHFYELRL